MEQNQGESRETFFDQTINNRCRPSQSRLASGEEGHHEGTSFGRKLSHLSHPQSGNESSRRLSAVQIPLAGQSLLHLYCAVRCRADLYSESNAG